MGHLRYRLPFAFQAACLTALVTTACTAPAEEAPVESGESALVDTAVRRSGTTISSPSVDRNKMYWGSRRIHTLKLVGAITAGEERVAIRADGILANTPPNDRLGVDELAELERRSATLLPAEKAAIQKLWQVLAADAAQSVVKAQASLKIISRDDAVVPTPTLLPVTATVENLARRIELTHDSDGNPETISGLDLQQAYADPSSYLPTELASFARIAQDIAKKSAPIAADQQSLTLDFAPLDGTVLAHTADVDIVLSASPSYAPETGKLAWAPAADYKRTNLAAKVITLDLETGEESYESNALLNRAGTKANGRRVEIWKAGVRVSIDVEASAPATIDFPYGYAYRTVSGPMMSMDIVNLSTRAWRRTPQSEPSGRSGSYLLTGWPKARVDVFTNGRVVLVDDNGAAHECRPSHLAGGLDVFVDECKIPDLDVAQTGALRLYGGVAGLGAASGGGLSTLGSLLPY